MNKKIIIILSLSIITILLVVFGIVYFVNQSNTKKITVDINQKNDSSYFVEKGLEEMAKIAKPAVENYATQNITESSAARNVRLKTYFANDSPVYSREIEIRSTNSATKTTASVKSINSSAAEGQYPMLIVETDITNFFGDNKNTSSQKYWVTIKKNADGSYIADDIGIWIL